jgi:hypothetical protein
MSASAGLTANARPSSTLFDLEALEGLPCGCVVAAYRARPWDVAVVSIEAKGPYCILTGHTLGQVLRLGDLADLAADAYGIEDDEDEESRMYRP